MKRLFLSSALASFMVFAIHAQQTTGSTAPSTSTSQQTTVQPSSDASLQTQGTLQTTTSTGVGQQTQAPLPQTGQATGIATTNQTQTTQLKIQAFTTADQPVATQIQQVLTAEPVLVQTLPMVNIQISGGVVILNGNVQCGAESVLMQNLIQQRLPNVIRIDNRLRVPGAFAPALQVPR